MSGDGGNNYQMHDNEEEEFASLGLNAAAANRKRVHNMKHDTKLCTEKLCLETFSFGHIFLHRDVVVPNF